MAEINLRCPKRDRSSIEGKAGWYSYYAGYSPDFVRDVFEYLHLVEGNVVLDPWNGSGTTTQVAAEMRYKAIGYDINPVMLIVAKARSLGSNVQPSLFSLCKDVLDKATQYADTGVLGSSEPLEIWLDQESAIGFRSIERAIQQLLVEPDGYQTMDEPAVIDKVSSLAAFFYVAAFRSLRAVLSDFQSSNPTWIKTPRTPSERKAVSREALHRCFSDHVVDMGHALNSKPLPSHHVPDQTEILLASSEAIPSKAETVDAVVSSPPYCTRIDYAIATRLELALLGFDQESLHALRQKMIGTPTIRKLIPTVREGWGETCRKFLRDVKNHSTKASKTYYYKTHIQYFDSIYRSLGEIRRLLKPGGHCVLVVQDSYYKDVHNDLPRIISEMGESLELRLSVRKNYEVNRSLAEINKKTGKYRKGKRRGTESVLIFERGAS